MFFELVALAIFIATTVFNVAPERIGATRKNDGTELKIVSPKSNVTESKTEVSDWVAVLKTKQSIFYADPSSLIKNGKTVKVWRLTDYKVAEINGDFVYLSKKLYEEYDCKKEQYRQLYVSLYPENMGAGKVIYSNAEIYSWMPVSSDAEGDAMWEIVCGQS